LPMAQRHVGPPSSPFGQVFHADQANNWPPAFV
jgi:hypothetical protein